MIYVIAYFNKNLGDDMFVHHLVTRYPNETFYFCETEEKLSAFKELNNIRFASHSEYFVLRVAARILRKQVGVPRDIIKEIKSKAIIKIGGSIYMESDGWKERKVKRLNSNQFVLGANFGPYHSYDFYHHCFCELSNANDCCFRDKYSYELFHSIEKVRFAPDILFSYDYPLPKKGRGVAISVIDLSNRGSLSSLTDEYEKQIRKIVKTCLHENVPVCLSSFCENEGDLLAIERIVMGLPLNNINILSYTGSIANFLEQINQYEYIIATRFHALIIGWSMKKKVLPIIYSQKQSHVLTDMNYVGPKWDLVEEPNIDDLSERLNLTHTICVTDYIEQSKSHFDRLDAFLNGSNN